MLRSGICVLFVAFYSSQLANGGVVNKTNEYIPIKYPGPIKGGTENRFGDGADDVPPECQGKNYCTVKPANYPEEEFNKMFSNQAPVPTLIINTLADRQGDPNDIDNCDSTVTYEPLYKVRSKRGWHTVIQAPEKNYVQMVRLESCKNSGAACFTAFPAFPGITTSCVQKYSSWEFLVKSENGNDTEKITAELPVCCSCHYKITG